MAHLVRETTGFGCLEAVAGRDGLLHHSGAGIKLHGLRLGSFANNHEIQVLQLMNGDENRETQDGSLFKVQFGSDHGFLPSIRHCVRPPDPIKSGDGLDPDIEPPLRDRSHNRRHGPKQTNQSSAGGPALSTCRAEPTSFLRPEIGGALWKGGVPLARHVSMPCQHMERTEVA